MERMLNTSTQPKKDNTFKFFLYGLLLSFLGSFVFLHDGFVYAQEETNSIPQNIAKLVYPQDLFIEKSYAPRTVIVRDMYGDKKYLVYPEKAKDILNSINRILDNDDQILPNENEYIPNNGVILVVKIDSKNITKTEAIPYGTQRVADNTLRVGEEIVETEGVNGVLEKTIRVIYKDDKPYSSTVIKERIVLASIKQVIRYGTKNDTVQSCTYWNKVVDRVAPKSSNKIKNAWMRFVMYCESGCDSGQNTKNKYYGLYQFSKSTYASYGGNDIFNGEEQIKVVSKMYDMPGNAAWHWPACNSAFEREYYK